MCFWPFAFPGLRTVQVTCSFTDWLICQPLTDKFFSSLEILDINPLSELANIFPVLQIAFLPDWLFLLLDWSFIHAWNTTCQISELFPELLMSFPETLTYDYFLKCSNYTTSRAISKLQGFSLRSLEHFEFVFMQVEKYQSIFILLHVDSQFSQEVLFPRCFDSFIKNWFAVNVWVYLCVVYSIY